MPLSAALETLFFTNAAGQLYYNPAGYIRLVWSAEYLTIETVQAFYEQALTLLLRTNSQLILSEHGSRTPLTPATQRWLTENWIPRAMREAGVKYCALVDGQNPMHRLTTQTVVSTAPVGFVFKRFTDRASAAAWLLRL